MTTITGSQTNEVGEVTNWIRCVFLGAKAVLSGFTLTNGSANNGGGVYCQACVVVTNCTLASNSGGYGGGAYGGTLDNCILTGNQARYEGGGACSATLNSCILMGNRSIGYMDVAGSGRGGGVSGCTLDNCTLRGNSARFGGGAERSTLNNCVLTGNSAMCGGGAYHGTLYNCTVTGNSASGGGGAQSSTLNNCTLSGNSAYYGGGAEGCMLYNCTLSGNSAVLIGPGDGGYGGGAYRSTLYNCIVYFNTAPIGANFFTGTSESGEEVNTSLHYCCTTPLPTNGVGNITGPPLFMDLAADDLRLWEGSPCIDAGVNLLGMPIVPFSDTMLPYSYEPTDILGNTRFIDGNGDGIVAWDIGAYEFNSFKPPRFIGSPQRTAEGWKLNITGEPNKWTRVQRTSNLKDWGEIWTGFMPADGIKQVTDTETNRMMFYRAVVP